LSKVIWVKAASMDFVTEYWKRAEECRALARRAIVEEHRKKMMDMAYQWEAMAIQREAVIQARPDLADIAMLPWRQSISN